MGKIIRNGITLASFNYEHEGRLITKSITTNDTYNASDDNADGYSSITVNVQPNLITKTITENGTYDAEDDNADGYSSVSVNMPSIPSGTHHDIWGGLDAPRTNIANPISAYYIENGELKEEIIFEVRSSSGYEGVCFTFPTEHPLIVGVNYNLTFTLIIPTGITFESGGYPFGCLHSSTQVQAGGFNLQATVSFTQSAGTYDITLPFTATAENYFVFVLAKTKGTQLFRVLDLQITEAT